MEDAASGNDDLLLTKMRALARRGALLRRQDDGVGVIEQADKQRVAQKIAPDEFLGMLDAGWIRAEAADRYVLSRRGITAVRNVLNRPRAVGPKPGIGGSAPIIRPARSVPGPKRVSLRPRLNVRESPLAWLAQHRDKDGRPLISSVELAAGERLRLDFERAQMGPRVTASWDAGSIPARGARAVPGFGMEMADHVVGARQRVEAALEAVGPSLSGMLLDVCCFLAGLEQSERNGGWPRRAGKVVLQLGLEQLARHYGLNTGTDARAVKVRTWHDEGWPHAQPDEAARPETSG